MARMFRRRRSYGIRRRYKGRRARSIRRRMLLRKRIKKFVNKMGYPSYVKMIGMTESKRLLLRKTLMLSAPVSTAGDNPKTNVFQVVLNPLECPNIERAYDRINVVSNLPTGETTIFRRFKYDYIRIKNIFISIKPAQTVSETNGSVTDNSSNLYADNGDTPISNVYAYFTYKFPMLSNKDNTPLTKEEIDAGKVYTNPHIVEDMYGTNPDANRIMMEGKMKNTYTWPSNKAMTISLNKLYYRVSTEPYKICANTPLDLQFLSTLADTSKNGIYNPFQFQGDLLKTVQTNPQNQMEYFDEEEDDDIGMRGTSNADSSVADIPDMGTSYFNLFFGRLVIVAPKRVRFTTEICYDCVLLR